MGYLYAFSLSYHTAHWPFAVQGEPKIPAKPDYKI